MGVFEFSPCTYLAFARHLHLPHFWRSYGPREYARKLALIFSSFEQRISLGRDRSLGQTRFHVECHARTSAIHPRTCPSLLLSSLDCEGC